MCALLLWRSVAAVFVGAAMALGTLAVVSLSGRCNRLSPIAAQSYVPSSHTSLSSLSRRSKNSPSLCSSQCVSFSARRHRSSASTLLCSAMFSSLDKLNLSSFGGDKDKYVRNSQRRSAAAEVSSVRGSSEDLSEAASDKNSSGPRAKFMAKRTELYELEEMERPLAEYMALPASQYSVLDAERIERVDDIVFKCYAHRFKFFNLEVGPVLLLRVEEQPDGCSIHLLSCTLEGSPIVVAQNQKFSASMVNKVFWRVTENSPSARQLISDTMLEVTVDIPFPFRAIPVSAIEGSGNKAMSQILKVMLPRFLSQLCSDYYAWASGDTSRKSVGTGEL